MNNIFIVASNQATFDYVHTHIFFKSREVRYINPRYALEKLYGFKDGILIIYGDISLISIEIILITAKSRNFKIFTMNDERALYV